MKNLLRKLHLILGLTTGIVVFIVGITGAIYAWEEDVREMLHEDLLCVEPGPTRVSVTSFVDSARAALPKGKVKNIRILTDDHRSVEVGFKNKESVFINPYTGHVLGSFNRDTDFFGTVLQIHRRLMLGDVGEIITGTSALIFGFMIISGIILWWPGSKFLRRQRLRIAWRAPRAKKIFDLHSVFGFYASWILVFSVVTGLVWSFKWFEQGMYFVAGSTKEESKVFSVVQPKDSTFTIDRIITAAETNYPQATEYVIVLPEDSLGSIRTTLRYPEEGFFRRQDHLFFDQYSGALISEKLFVNTSAGEKWRAANFDIHTGRKFGLTGKLIMFFAALIAASLPVTGFLYWRAKENAKKQGVLRR
ncbi:MAG TPA: PepSY-associated TM helix domain-containing protein [Bacteroidia bacterium]|nr:PepSY-associated TM helix domain-containing protein [Bacteroidia bacterium]